MERKGSGKDNVELKETMADIQEEPRENGLYGIDNISAVNDSILTTERPNGEIASDENVTTSVKGARHGNGFMNGDSTPAHGQDTGNGCVLQMEGDSDLGVGDLGNGNMGVVPSCLDKQDSQMSLKPPGAEAGRQEESDEVPEYLPQFRSKRGLEVGSENLITNNDLRLAATLVADAMEGHSFELKREPRFVRSYNLFKSMKLRIPLYVAILVSLSLPLFEEPALSELIVPYWATMAVEVICLAYFIFRISHHWHWRMPYGFKKDVKNIIAIVCIVITVFDMAAYVVTRNWFPAVHSVRYSRSLRALLIMTFSDGTHLRRAWSNIRMTLKEIVHVIALFYFLIIVFSLVSMKMFQHRDDMKFPDGSAYFKNYLECFWQLYVLVTTANNPDVMMPAYDKSRWYSVFFTVFIVLCLYLMLNILLAVTYNSYRENMKDQIKESALQKTKTLHQAFEVIKIHVDGNEMVTYKTWLRLIKLAHPGKTKHQIDLLMMVLDTDKTGYISRQQFLSVADLLNVPLSEVSERKNLLEIHCPAFYLSRGSKALHTVVSSVYFSLFYDLVVVINVVLICIDINVAEWYFFGLYMLEILLKWYTVGTRRYFHNFQNWTDVFITMMSLGVLIVTDMNMNESGGNENSETLSVLNVFRIFRLLRMLVQFERFKIIFDAVFNVSFSILTYACILFIVFYAFAVIGMEIFAGKVVFLGYNGTMPSPEQRTCNNSALEGSAFVANRYCNINFNDVISAFVVVASLLIVNNWHIICEGFVLATHKSARVYFMMFHLCVAVVVMNIVTAFILDMFMHEYTFSKKGNIDTKVEMTIKNLQLGIDAETGMEIEENGSAPTEPDKPQQRRQLSRRGQSSKRGPANKNVFRRLTVRNKTHVAKPNLSRYDGIRFHIKKRGWTKTELLLQQLFELEDEQEKHMHNEDIRLNTG